MMISREDLEEKSWHSAVELSDDQVEQDLLLPLIEKLNKYHELDLDWTCSGNTLVATIRHHLDNAKERPIFFICKIQKVLQAK